MGHSRRLLACLVATLALVALTSAARAQIDTSNVADLALKWDVPLGGGVTATPVLANGLLYVLSWDGLAYALDPDDGSVVWSFDTGSGLVIGMPGSAMVGPNGNVCFGDSLAHIWCRNGLNGSAIWDKSVGAFLVDAVWSALATAKGRLFVSIASLQDQPCTNGRLIALDLDTGADLWTLETVPDKICDTDTSVECSMDSECGVGGTCVDGQGAGVTATVSFDPNGNSVYMNTVGCFTFPSIGDSDTIFKIDAATGAVIWKTRVNPPEQFGYCAGDPNVAACGLCTDPNAVSCSAAACAVGSCTEKPVYQDYGFLNGPIPVDIPGGTILVSGSKNGTLYALNESDGSIAWTNAVVPLPVTPDFAGFGLFNGPIAIADGRVHAALNQLCTLANAAANGCFEEDPNLPPDDHLQAFDVETGATLWTAESDASWSGIGLVNGVVYAGSNVIDPAEFFAYDSETGTRLATFSLPNTTVSRATVDGESLYIGYGTFGGGGVRAYAPATLQDKDQQKCINALNKNFAKVAKTQGKDNCSCIKDFAKNKLTGTIESCLTSDLKGKVAKAKSKTVSDETKNCAVSTPGFGATSSSVVNATAMQKELDLIHDVFGSDLDAAIFTEEAEKDLSKCQQQAAKQV
ncbi:MAG: PQQ-binding-like beta-propeller repeat protein, partial [Deltaproteobacteria bacterium]|nr:PQQ-binding-like beta-propeller repeat protein [Deltaproteobacteria bacterium]